MTIRMFNQKIHRKKHCRAIIKLTYLRVVLLSCLISGVLFSCGSTSKQQILRKKYLTSTKTLPTHFTDSIAFKNVLGLSIIPVKIEGYTYHFLFDTGAPTVISPELSQEFIAFEEKPKKITLDDAMGISTKVDLSLLPELSIHHTTFKNVGVLIKDLSNFKSFCINIDGIIGANLMRSAVWKIDYTRQVMHFSDRRKNVALQDPEASIGFKENFVGTPMISLTDGNVSFQADWDTGYNGQFQITDSLQSFLNKYRSHPVESINGKGFPSSTLNQESLHKTQPLQQLKLDTLIVNSKFRPDAKRFSGYLIKNVVVEREKSPASILFGNKLISSAETVVLDWGKHRILLDKTPTSKLEKSFGFAPLWQNGKIVVIKLWENASVKKAGLHLGDTLVSINGIDLKNLSQDEFCTSYPGYKKQDAIKFMIKRGDSTQAFSVKRVPLFSSQ